MTTTARPDFVPPAPGPRSADPASPTRDTRAALASHATADAVGDAAAPGTRARWERPALGALLLLTAVLYLWDLSASGYANQFYAAAAQAGSVSWKAWLFGASDAGASITVDKPPASLWVMGLSVRVFGLSSWAVLAPQALMGVGTVGVLYASVRRRFSAGAALVAGAVLALTPVAALMFRFDNPDALLVLLLTASVWATMRAIDGPRTTRWMVLAGALVGLAFLTKQLQAFLVLPGIAVAFLWAAPVSFAKRLRDGLLAVLAMVVAGGWWVALVELLPASARPYIGGSQDNSFLELTFGYNGLGRLSGDEVGSVGGGGANAGGNWGATGITRMFGSEMGGQVAWLIPAALVLGVAALALLARARRTDARRAEVVVWLGWLLVTGLTFSFMAGIFHAYYTVALAPAIGALVGIGSWLLWQRRASLWALGTLAGVTLLTAIWSFTLLGRSSQWLPWLRWIVLSAGIAAAVLLLVAFAGGAAVARAGAAVALVAGLLGPAAYTVHTVSTAHTGSIPSAGPTVSGGFGGGFGGGPGGGFGGGFGGGGMPQGAPGGQNGQQGQGGFGGAPGGQPGTGQNGQTENGAGGFGGRGGGTGGGTGGGGMGGLLDGASVSTELRTLLEQDADRYTWVAATVGSQNAASYQLATQESVMPIGGFNGSDPSPTLAQFQAWVAEGRIHYFVGGGGLGQSSGGANVGSQIQAWVAASYTAQTVGGVTVYDLTQPSSTSSSTDTSSTSAT
jgi:4-amino-4-deoxy-L-arabinose transferase-like glycosyltransferase